MTGRRVAVTGIGMVTPMGNSPTAVWEAARVGQSPVRKITRFDATDFRSQIAAEIDDFDFSAYKTIGRHDRLDRFSQFAVAAASQAIDDAGLERESTLPTDTAVYLGSALGGIAFGEEEHERYLARGLRSVAPALALSVFAGAGATNVSIEFGLRGPSISNANSCASGAIAIGEAFHLIRSGGADIALAGGVECPLAPLTYGSFSLIRAMSKRNEDPSRACRPFDRDRDGFVMGEGAAVLVLECWERARERDAHVRGEILGYATTNDAHHMTIPRPDGSEAARAMRIALADAGCVAHAVRYINAHATGTVLGDEAESRAIQAVFGPTTPAISGTKPLHGHSLGASAAIEAAITLMALEHAFIPGTVNLDNVASDCEGDHVRMPGRRLEGGIALSNAFGFGGINAALVLGKVESNGHGTS